MTAKIGPNFESQIKKWRFLKPEGFKNAISYLSFKSPTKNSKSLKPEGFKDAISYFSLQSRFEKPCKPSVFKNVTLNPSEIITSTIKRVRFYA